MGGILTVSDFSPFLAEIIEESISFLCWYRVERANSTGKSGVDVRMDPHDMFCYLSALLDTLIGSPSGR
jgi:hypothetical protein